MSQPASAVMRRQADVEEARDQFKDISAAVEHKKDAIVATLPQTIPADYFIAVALQAVTRQPRLLECTRASLIKAMTDAAELALMPGLAGQCYLVPYKNRSTQQYEANLIVGYRGFITLAVRSGEVATVEGRVVRSRDEFDFEYGTNQNIRHVPYMNLRGERDEPTIGERGEERMGELLDAGDYVAAFSRVVMRSGKETFDVMSAAEVNLIRKRSKATDGPWSTDTAEMWRKTPTRRLLKYVPSSSIQLARAFDLEDAAEGGAVQVTQGQQQTSQARVSLAASLGVSSPADGAPTVVSGQNESDDIDAAPGPSVGITEADIARTMDPDAETIETALFCGKQTGDGTCVLKPGHEGDHE